MLSKFRRSAPPIENTDYYESLIDSIGVGKSNRTNREAWLKKTLKKIPNNQHILDAGAGELQYKKFCNHLRYTSQDFAQYDGQGDTSSLQTDSWDNSKLDIISDITNIPVKEKSFDAIMCVEVFEHIPKPLDALMEFQRIIRPGGKLIITAPFCAMTHFAPYFFHTGYSEYFYKEHLPRYGFEIDEITKNGNYFDYLAQELIRLEYVASRYTPKAEFDTKDLRNHTLALLETLGNLSRQGKKSNELMCYGLQIVATKKKKIRNGKKT